MVQISEENGVSPENKMPQQAENLANTLKNYFSFSPLQEAIKHNSFFEPKRKLEQGNVDQAFETVDNIIEGKLQNTFDEKLLSVFGFVCLFFKSQFYLFSICPLGLRKLLVTWKKV